jgi:ketosteroid isomerase-like protein
VLRRSLAVLLFAAIPAAAQTPFQRPPDRAEELAAYRAEIRSAVDKEIDAWKRSWDKRDVGGASNHYADDAILVDGPTAHYSKAMVAEYLGRILPTVDSLTLSVADFDATATLAYASGRYSISRRTQTGAVRQENGVYVLILKTDRGRWRIRSQIMMPEGQS